MALPYLQRVLGHDIKWVLVYQCVKEYFAANQYLGFDDAEEIIASEAGCTTDDVFLVLGILYNAGIVANLFFRRTPDGEVFMVPKDEGLATIKAYIGEGGDGQPSPDTLMLGWEVVHDL